MSLMNGHSDVPHPLALLAECRRRFFCEYRAQIETGKFDVEDIRRVRTEDIFVLQFIRRCNDDLDVTLPVIVESLKWRLTFGVNKLGVKDIASVLDKQVMYIHGYDLENQALLWFNVRNHRKDSAENEGQKMIVFWLEKFTRENAGKPLVIVFDMTQSGLQNMDLDLIKFLLNCLKYHFPGLLAYLLVYEIPWILNAAWKLIKSWLDPAAQKKILFVDKKNVSQYVDIENLAPHMGGNDEYRLELCTLLEYSNAKDLSPTIEQDQLSIASDTQPDDFVIRRRAVHFADSSSYPTTPIENEISVSPDITDISALNVVDDVIATSTVSPQTQRMLSHKAREIAHFRDNSQQPLHSTQLLDICPSEELVFESVDGESDRVDVIILKHVGVGNVAFKIKTTSPEKFRVRPSGGVIKEGKSIVKIYLSSEYASTVHKDKFLILSLRLPTSKDYDDLNSEDLSSVWKRASKDDIDEHRLRCRLSPLNNTTLDNEVSLSMSTNAFTLPPPCDPLIKKIAEDVANVRRESALLRKLLLVTVSLLIIVLVHQRLAMQHIYSLVQHTNS